MEKVVNLFSNLNYFYKLVSNTDRKNQKESIDCIYKKNFL